MVYTINMLIAWDVAKAASNLAKHGVDFGSVEMFDWSSAKVMGSLAHSEPRLSAYGLIGERLHVLVYSIENRAVRIISLRKANRREIEQWQKLK